MIARYSKAGNISIRLVKAVAVLGEKDLYNISLLPWILISDFLFKSNLKRMIIQIYFGNCAVLQYTLHFREGMLIERSLSFSANAVR